MPLISGPLDLLLYKPLPFPFLYFRPFDSQRIEKREIVMIVAHGKRRVTELGLKHLQVFYLGKGDENCQ